MSLTYPSDVAASEAASEEFVPVYARRGKAARGSQKKVRTWMILAPVAGVMLVGGGALMLMNSGSSEPTPLAEPAAAPAIAPMSVEPTAPAGAAITTTAMAPVASAQLVVGPDARRAEPVRSAQPAARRAAPVEGAAPAPRVEIPAEPTGLRAYSASTSTPAVSPAPAPATTAPRAPSITVQPLS